MPICTLVYRLSRLPLSPDKFPKAVQCLILVELIVHVRFPLDPIVHQRLGKSALLECIENVLRLSRWNGRVDIAMVEVDVGPGRCFV